MKKTLLMLLVGLSSAHASTLFECTESVYPAGYPLSVVVEQKSQGLVATVYPRSYASSDVEGVPFTVTPSKNASRFTSDGFQLQVGRDSSVLSAPGLHEGDAIDVNCR